MCYSGKGGSIINLTSRVASVGVPTMTIYGATKGALLSLTRGAAGTLDTFVIGYLFFGSPLTATTYTIAQGIAHKTLYYFYEVAWQKVALQSDKRAAWKVLPIGVDS